MLAIYLRTIIYRITAFLVPGRRHMDWLTSLYARGIPS